MVFNREIITQSPQETAKIGEELGSEQPHIICLYGELGSGKTTFAQGFAKGLGIKTRLLSPTFIIVRRYPINNKKFFYHVDLYRTTKSKELVELGLSEILADPSSFVLIEWAERLGNLLPKARLDIHFSTNPEGNHLLRIQKH